jgi:putative Holliday junction resolvase
LSDELGMYAHARPALQFSTTAALVADVLAIVRAEGVAEVVAGLPLSLSGVRGPQAERLQPIVRALRAGLGVPVREWDERFSSTQAARHVRGRDKRRSGELDSASAAVVLQAVLDSRRAGART